MLGEIACPDWLAAATFQREEALLQTGGPALPPVFWLWLSLLPPLLPLAPVPPKP